MAATVTNGLTNVTLANNNTGFSVWKRDGTGGTPSAISETDVFIQGTGACSVKVSNQGIVLAYATGGINLSASGTHVYIWANMLAGGLMANRASNGLCVCLSSDATLTTGSNYSFWAVDGADTYPGGWVRYVIDVSKTRTTGAGTLNLSSVQHIGMYCDTRPNVAKFDNLVIDRIDYAVAGTGLEVTGTSTTDDLFGDILAADEGTVGNKYGIVTSKEGIIYVRGAINLGDISGAVSSTHTDIDKTVVFESPKYYNGSSVVDAVSTTFQQFNIYEDTGTTSVTLGKKVGTGDSASGRNGVTFIQSDVAVTMDFDVGGVSDTNIYGSTFQGITGGLNWGTDTTHECIGNNFSGCTQFNPGSVIVRACNFINTSSTAGALLWNSNINIQKSGFFANTTGAGIEHNTWNGTASGTVTTADATGTTLIDSAASFLSTAAVNDIVYNETDQSYGTITSVDSNTQVTISTLTGGTDNDFDLSDAYSIATPFTYTDLVFSGNTNDVDNTTSPANVVAISKTGTSNPATFPSGDFVVIQGSVTVTINVKDTDGNAISGVQTGVYVTSDRTELLNTDTNGSGVASTSYAGSTPVQVEVRCRKASSGSTKYINYSSIQNIASGTGLTLDVTLREDTINNATS